MNDPNKTSKENQPEVLTEMVPNVPIFYSNQVGGTASDSDVSLMFGLAPQSLGYEGEALNDIVPQAICFMSVKNARALKDMLTRMLDDLDASLARKLDGHSEHMEEKSK